MEVNRIIEQANDVADKYNLHLIEIDRTDNTISLKLLIDNELFIQIYGNAEGGKYHCHPFDDPDGYIFVDERKSIQEFVQDSMRFLEENEIL